MLAPLIFLVFIAVVVSVVKIRSTRRRRADAVPVVTTWPEIELNQPYGGWDACAYDAGTGRDHSLPTTVRLRLTRRPQARWPRSNSGYTR